jgi:hypothetical protein
LTDADLLNCKKKALFTLTGRWGFFARLDIIKGTHNLKKEENIRKK